MTDVPGTPAQADEPPSWLEDAFHAIVDSSDAEDRSRRLADLCREHPDHAEQLRGWARQAELPTPPPDHPDPPPPDRIGPYRVLGVLGEGGMGTVYIAEQITPVRRRVALKVVKLGLATKNVLARFDGERQALAMMQHPNIAKVLDAGVTDSGQPYFVMDLVRGTPITTYCDRNRLPIDARLRLLIQVCRGVQHAHHKGVIHRDLKPSNVLVEMQDGQPLARIIDFGLARATDYRLTEHTVYTEFGQIIGSPEYMSPEQAEMSGAGDIDTRADVYSLGVLMFELLTGRLPFDTGELRTRAPGEIQRFLRDSEVPKPSTRISDRDPESLAASKDRASDLRALRHLLRGDLDRIALTALAKDRTLRYQTATELAQDIERFLRHEPILAAPPSVGYRLSKWIRRYRAAALVALVVLTSLVGGFAVSLWQYLRAEDAYRLAQRVVDAYPTIDHRIDFDQLRSAFDELWPRSPSQKEAMDHWLEEARALAGKQGLVEQALLTIEEEPESSPAARGRQPYLVQEFHRLIGDLATLDDPEVGLIALIEQRRTWIEALDDARRDPRWSAAITAIRNDPRYGFDLVPQLGLLPLRTDPDSGLYEFWHMASGDEPHVDPVTGSYSIEEGTGMVLVLIPGGPSHLGTDTDPEATAAEAPVLATMLAPYFISKYEMSQGQWVILSTRFGAIAGLPNGNPSAIPPGHQGYPSDLTHPVESVSWVDCSSLLTRYGLELPTEAQWEHACRGDSKWSRWCAPDLERLLSTGPSINILDADALDAEVHAPPSYSIDYRDGYALHAPIGSYGPNDFGLHGVLGNVFEWCRDSYTDYDKAVPAPGDGLLSPSAPTSKRPVRGASWRREATEARCTRRGAPDLANKSDEIGVRPARAVIREPS